MALPSWLRLLAPARPPAPVCALLWAPELACFTGAKGPSQFQKARPPRPARRRRRAAAGFVQVPEFKFDGAKEYPSTWCHYGCAVAELDPTNKFGGELDIFCIQGSMPPARQSGQHPPANALERIGQQRPWCGCPDCPASTPPALCHIHCRRAGHLALQCRAQRPGGALHLLLHQRRLQCPVPVRVQVSRPAAAPRRATRSAGAPAAHRPRHSTTNAP